MFAHMCCGWTGTTSTVWLPEPLRAVPSSPPELFLSLEQLRVSNADVAIYNQLLTSFGRLRAAAFERGCEVKPFGDRDDYAPLIDPVTA